MKITVLDKSSIGMDTPLDTLYNLGEVTVYDSTAPGELDCHIGDSDVIVLNKVKITRDALLNSSNLKLVCVFATGYDNIDISTAIEKGIAVCNVPGYSTDSVAQFTIGTVLSLCMKLNVYSEYVKSGSYTTSGVANRLTPVYHEIKGKTWGIIGYGNIGSAVGRVAEAFGARVIVNKRTPIAGCECVDIDTLCRESDIITIHCPLNKSTYQLINEKRINLMKSNVILVNEARGAVLDEAAVAQAVLDGRIGAFGCDVYSVEPMTAGHPYQSIKTMDNVLLTPHAAWGAYEARVRCINIISNNISEYLSGEKTNRVDI